MSLALVCFFRAGPFGGVARQKWKTHFSPQKINCLRVAQASS